MRPLPRRAAAALLRLALAAALLAALLQLADPRALQQTLAGAEPRWLAAGLVSAVAANALSALRWWALARWLGSPVGPGWALARYAGGIALNALLPGAVVGGDLYRAHGLRQRGLGWGAAGLSVLVDRLAGLWMLGVLALAAAGGVLLLDPDSLALAALTRAVAGGAPGAGPALGAGLLLLALALGLAPLAALPRTGIRPAGSAAAPERWAGPDAALARVPGPAAIPQAVAVPDRAEPAVTAPRSSGGLAARLHALQALRQRPGARSQLALQLAASVGVQLLSIATLACAGAALGVVLPAWAWAVAALPIFVMATLPISFGGWGTREAAALLALGAFGVPAAPALGVGLLYGLAALAQALPGALVLLPRLSGAAR